MLRAGKEPVVVEKFTPPPCPYCDLDIKDLDCTCFDYGR